MKKWVLEILQRARAERARSLDLGNCGLESVPEQIFDMPDLEVLILGPHYYDPDKDTVVDSANRGPGNAIRELPSDFHRLPNLQNLSLCSNPIADITPLSGARQLTRLLLSNTCVANIECLTVLVHLTHLSLGANLTEGLMVQLFKAMSSLTERNEGFEPLYRPSQIEDLSALNKLSALQVLDISTCTAPNIADLSRNWTSLRELNLTGIQIDDISALGRIKTLTRLYLGNTSVHDISQLAQLTRLSHLSLEYTPILSVAALSRLPDLAELSLDTCTIDSVDSLTQLGCLSKLRLIGFRGDLQPLTKIPRLAELSLGNPHDLPDFSNMSEDKQERAQLNLAPLAALASLTTLRLQYVERVDLSDLPRSLGLSDLSIFQCTLDDITHLGCQASITCLSITHSEVQDISALSRLIHLKSLDLSHNPIADIIPIASLTGLEGLNISSTLITDLGPVVSLLRLKELDAQKTRISDISAIAGLTSLTSLSFGETRVSDISDLAKLQHIETLLLGNTQVADITPIASMLSLKHLDIENCPVESLRVLSTLPHAERANASNCKLTSYPRDLLSHPRLFNLHLTKNPIADCPPEIFAKKDYYTDNLKAARAHFADLEHGQVEDRELKLLIIGNGRVGKTSLVRRLVHGGFDPTEESTHGIRTETWSLMVGEEPVRLNIWDFGGQDIYFGTHSLFLGSGTIFLILWDPLTERTRYHEHGALRFENYPLAYWIDYVEHHRPGARVIIVENKCDSNRPPSLLPADPRGRPTLAFSAKTGRGAAILTEMLREACQAELGAARQIGVGRHAVKAAIRRLQDADDRRPHREREHRLMAHDEFLALCATQNGLVSSPSALLTYLCDTGVLFYRRELFDQQVILDQRWALDCIYTLFDRKRCYNQLRARKGRFRRQDLDDLAWHDLISIPEQRLILSFMSSCSLCFPAEQIHTEDPVYIAPDLLPERDMVEYEIDLRLRAHEGDVRYRYEHRFIHDGLMRRFMARVGHMCKGQAVYWRGGVIFEAKNLVAVAEVTCKRRYDTDPASGEIELHVRGRQRDSLLDILRRTFRALRSEHVCPRELVSVDGEEWIDVARLAGAALCDSVPSESRRRLSAALFSFLLDHDAEASSKAEPFRAPVRVAIVRSQPSFAVGQPTAASPEVSTTPPGDAASSTPRPVSASTTLDEDLSALLLSLYATDEIRQLVSHVSDGALDHELNEQCTRAQLAHQAVKELRRHGYIDATLFARMREQRPRRAAEIDALARRFACP